MEELTEIQKKQIKIMDHYGEDRQLEKLVEECAELIKAIMKSKTIDDNVVEEMADVKNLLEQFELTQICLIDTIESVIESKVDRELERIKTYRKKMDKGRLIAT